MFDFKDKRVLVTGGTRGIGRGIVEGFLAAGARVAVNGSTPGSTARAVAELGTGVVAAPGSVATAAGCHAIVAAARAGLGGLDILVNNAGVGAVEQSLDRCTEADWDAVIDTNLKGVFFMTQAAAPDLRATHGTIVNVASISAVIGDPGYSVYGASKAGVVLMTRSHALELAPHVRVNAVCPGPVDTDMLRGILADAFGSVEKGLAVAATWPTALKRVATVREVVGPVLYLASDLASFITGTAHMIDGGESID